MNANIAISNTINAAISINVNVNIKWMIIICSYYNLEVDIDAEAPLVKASREAGAVGPETRYPATSEVGFCFRKET